MVEAQAYLGIVRVSVASNTEREPPQGEGSSAAGEWEARAKAAEAQIGTMVTSRDRKPGEDPLVERARRGREAVKQGGEEKEEGEQLSSPAAAPAAGSSSGTTSVPERVDSTGVLERKRELRGLQAAFDSRVSDIEERHVIETMEVVARVRGKEEERFSQLERNFEVFLSFFSRS